MSNTICDLTDQQQDSENNLEGLTELRNRDELFIDAWNDGIQHGIKYILSGSIGGALIGGAVGYIVGDKVIEYGFYGAGLGLCAAGIKAGFEALKFEICQIFNE